MPKLFLGRVVDQASGQVTEEDMIYEGDRLVTHAIGLGMTGSGKTGLCVGLLEELTLAGVPLLIIDPKGDMANLALVFDQLEADDFAPWVDPAEARQSGHTVEQVGAGKAALWKQGLADWGIGKERLAELRQRMALTVYTPGSESGVPVNVLGAFDPPGPEVLGDPTARRELVAGTVGGLLSLVGVESDPVRDPEHVVLSRILDQAWSQGESLEMRDLIRRLIDPPFTQVGVFDVDEFFKPDKRMKLAMKLNGVIASPSFAPWTRGAPLDIEAFTTAVPAEGDQPARTRVSLFYLAHLDDTERMFFASLLLERIVAWSRTQSGTGALRALVYFDEVFGYLPPYPKNPPTKGPVLTLLKQARAVGVGVTLVTQNPVDLDYKAISNAGTWFIGRLQTERDRERVMEGLLSASGGVDRAQIERLFDGLRKRVFLLHDVRADRPRLFHTRWAMSFLRGPMSRREIEQLCAEPGRLAPPPSPAPDVTVESIAAPQAAPKVVLPPRLEDRETMVLPADPGVDDPRWRPPVAPEGMGYRFLDPRVCFSARMAGAFAPAAEPPRKDGRVRWEPALYADVELRFDEARAGFEHRERQHRVWYPADQGCIDRQPLWLPLQSGDFLPGPPGGSIFMALPTWTDEPIEFANLRQMLVSDLLRTQSRGLWINPSLKLWGLREEKRHDFVIRCAQEAQRRIERRSAELGLQYRDKARSLEVRIRERFASLSTKHAEAQRRHHEALAAAVTSVVGRFTGEEMPPQVRRAWQEVTVAKSELKVLDGELRGIKDRMDADLRRIRTEMQSVVQDIHEHVVGLEQDDIHFAFLGVLWIPVTRRL